MTNCKFCKQPVDPKATRCSHCQGDLRNWFLRHKFLTFLIIIIALPLAISSVKTKEQANNAVKIEVENKASLSQKAEEQKKVEEEWNKSPAKLICDKHPTWSKEDCMHLFNKEVWIGMSYEQLVYLKGEPVSSNVSNYGYGNSYQYCYSFTSSPNCFYDKDDDKIIDSYN